MLVLHRITAAREKLLYACEHVAGHSCDKVQPIGHHRHHQGELPLVTEHYIEQICDHEC